MPDPSSAPTDPDLDLALSLADLADHTTVPRFGADDLEVQTKPDDTPVTEVDRGVERLLREHIAAERPGDVVIGEEFGVAGGEDGDSARRWVIDPIDGTKNFMRGVPIWGTLIALERDGELCVGVVSAPALGRRWWAARGQGAYAEGAYSERRRLHVSKVATVADAMVSYSDISTMDTAGITDRFMVLARRAWRTRALGDFWSHVLVAEGVVDLAVEPGPGFWDLAALLVIVEEAGGRFTDLRGQPRADGGGGLSSNGLVHEEALAALAGEG